MSTKIRLENLVPGRVRPVNPRILREGQMRFVVKTECKETQNVALISISLYKDRRYRAYLTFKNRASHI